MIKQPLIDKQTKKTDSQKFLFTSEMSPITRYNKVIDVYNVPSFRGDEPELQRIPHSDLYEWEFMFLAKTRGKVIFGFLCLLPGIDLVVLGFSIFFALYYWKSLSTVEENSKKVLDPFKKMTFDPELCYQMGCDFYQFNIELKELSGFSLNYQENVSDRLNLKKERGKTSLLVYNATFWASYSYVSQWKISHYLPFLCSIVLCLTINILLIVLIAI